MIIDSHELHRARFLTRSYWLHLSIKLNQKTFWKQKVNTLYYDHHTVCVVSGSLCVLKLVCGHSRPVLTPVGHALVVDCVFDWFFFLRFLCSNQTRKEHCCFDHKFFSCQEFCLQMKSIMWNVAVKLIILRDCLFHIVIELFWDIVLITCPYMEVEITVGHNCW